MAQQLDYCVSEEGSDILIQYCRTDLMALDRLQDLFLIFMF